MDHRPRDFKSQQRERTDLKTYTSCVVHRSVRAPDPQAPGQGSLDHTRDPAWSSLVQVRTRVVHVVPGRGIPVGRDLSDGWSAVREDLVERLPWQTHGKTQAFRVALSLGREPTKV